MRILLIDDDACVLRAFSRMLRAHEITATTSARDAVSMVQRGQTFDAILCDLRMPNMTGRELNCAIESCAPDLASRIIFMSGGPCNTEDTAFAKIHPVLMKPFSVRELSLSLMQMLPRLSPLCA